MSPDREPAAREVPPDPEWEALRAEVEELLGLLGELEASLDPLADSRGIARSLALLQLYERAIETLRAELAERTPRDLSIDLPDQP